MIVAGTLSLNVAPFAVLGPAFAIVSVYAIDAAALTLAGALLTIDTFASAARASLSDPLALAPDATSFALALFTSGSVASEAANATGTVKTRLPPLAT